MAKLTISGLQSLIKTYVESGVQAGAWTKTTNNIYGLIDKIGKQVMIDGEFNDRLGFMNGEDLELGKTIEEYFVDLTLPQAYSSAATDGANTMAPAMPTVEAAAYSTTCGRQYIKTTEPYDNLERAAVGANEASAMLTKITKRLFDSYAYARYTEKKQMIAELITKAEAATNKANLVQQVSAVVDTASAEAFIKTVKTDVETASFPTEGHNLGNCLIGAANNMVLLVKKGVMPTIEVDALAGAFNKGDLAIPAKVVVVDDFAGAADKYMAVLIDERALKLHNGYQAIRTQENAQGDYVNFVRHFEDTAFISKFAFVKVYKTAA